MKREVVITGVGAVGGFGAGRDALLAHLRAGRPAIVEAPRATAHHRRGGSSATLAPVPREALGRWLPPAKARRMSPPSRFAVAAAREALADAGAAGSEATAIALGTAFGPASYTEQLLDQIFVDPLGASPSTFAECVANAPAGQVAIDLAARGPNATIAQREASLLLSCGVGFADLVNGRADRALCGCAEEQSALLLAALDRFRALARGAPRPFDRRRDGLLVGEGSAVILIERDDVSIARTAPVRAVLRGVIRAFDPSAPAWEFGHGAEALADRLVRGLARMGLAPADLRLVVSGASGARRGDALEAAVLRAAFRGAALPPVTAPKGTLGEYGGGLLAAAVLAVESGEAFPTAGFEEIDPALGVAPARERVAIERGPVLVTSLACGGAAAWMVLDPP